MAKKIKRASVSGFSLVSSETRLPRKRTAKALTARVLQEFPTLHTDGPIYLHTQTWSHQAIALYKKMGFTFIAENLDGTPNPDYEKVMQVLSKLDK